MVKKLFREENGLFYVSKSVTESPFDKWSGYLRDDSKQGVVVDEIVGEMRGE